MRSLESLRTEVDKEMVNLGDEFPDFEKDTSKGKIKFHEFIHNR